MFAQEDVSMFFDKAKGLSERTAAKEQLLDKNRIAIANPDGTIPVKYQVKFAELENEVNALKKQESSMEEVLVKVAESYIRDNAMGNLYFEKDAEGTQYFEDTYLGILEKYWKRLSKAISDKNFNILEELISYMRNEFVGKAFPQYVNYSKGLSFNKI